MKTIFHFSIILTLSIVLLHSCKSDSSIKGPATIITNVTIIDAIDGLRENQTIVIKEDRIIQISDQNINFSGEGNIIDGNGKYLIPGLWDAHAHLTFIDGLAPAMFDLFTAYGITGIRDTGGQLDSVVHWKNYALTLGNKAPIVKIAGPLLDGIPTVYNGSGPSYPPLGVGAMSPEEGIALVDKCADAGVDLIKSYEMLSPETFAAIIDRAHEKNLVVTGHVPLSMDVVTAVNGGLNSMEHMRNLEMACTASYDSLLEVRNKMLSAGMGEVGGVLRSNIHRAQRSYAIAHQDAGRTAEVLAALKKNDTWQIPTLGIVCGRLNRLYADESWVENFKYLPEPVRSRWIESAHNYADQTANEESNPYGLWGLEMIQKLKDADIRIMAGTDTPIFFLTPGESLHKELQFLVQGGLTPMEALESATLLPAKYFNMEKNYGSVSVGKVADLLLLDANPLDAISNTLAINTLIRNGEIFDRKALDGFLKSASEKTPK
jgi:imidazolonepropionase-like amidohydrolase